MSLPFLTYYEGPRLMTVEAISGARSYREAVRLCWLERTRKNLTGRVLAEESGTYPSHVCECLSEDEKRRELPAKHINAFEIACGNRAISQWLAAQAQLTILETLLQQRAA